MVVCTELAHLADYSSPLAPGALPKTVLAFCGVFSLEASSDGASARSLAQQLEAAGGGFEVECWSRLPQGSGMGTSSILAAALVACIGRSAGVVYEAEMLVHAVVAVEQMLTTGGGWQDQVGGIFGGIKRCESAPALPLAVRTTALPIASAKLRQLSGHLQLVYTGKTRLARNLLQDVLRRWYSAHPDILNNVQALVANARALETALYDGNVAAVGGGGFMILVTKEANARAAVEEALSDEMCTCHDVEIHESGLQTIVG